MGGAGAGGGCFHVVQDKSWVETFNNSCHLFPCIPCTNGSFRLSRHYICALGMDGWMYSSPEELLALELDTGHPASLQVRLQTTDLSECLLKERVSGREVCQGMGAPHLHHCLRHFGIGALPAFLPRALSAD